MLGLPKDAGNAAKLAYYKRVCEVNKRCVMLLVATAGPEDRGEYVVFHNGNRLNAPQAVLLLGEVLASLKGQAVAGERAAGPDSEEGEAIV